MPFNRSLAGQSNRPVSTETSWKDAALYALGVGAEKDELEWLYEGRGPKVLPSFAVVPIVPARCSNLLARSGGDLSLLVHNAERVTVHAPIAPRGRLCDPGPQSARFTICIRFAQVLVDARTEDDRGQLVAETTSTMLFRDQGGFGGEPPPKEVGAGRETEGRAAHVSCSRRSPRPSKRCSTACRGTTTRSTPTPTSGAPWRRASTEGRWDVGLPPSASWCDTSREAVCGWGREPLALVRSAVSPARVAGRYPRHRGMGRSTRRRGVARFFRERDEAVITAAWAQFDP